MAVRKRTPRIPMATAVRAITAGPTRNRATIDTIAQVFPQATSLGCNAMYKPTLNMAIPVPVLDNIEMELSPPVNQHDNI